MPARCIRLLAAAALQWCFAAAAPAFGTPVAVTIAPELADPAPVGRLVVCLIPLTPGQSTLGPNADPVDAPFWDDQPPMFAVDVAAGALTAEKMVLLDDTALASGPAASALPPGRYRIGAKLITTRQSSSWRRDPGNLYSEPMTAEIRPDDPLPIRITLTKRTQATPWPAESDRSLRVKVELFEIKSELLSKFHHKDIFLRAGVVYPANFRSERTYAAIYEVPGYGGDHTDASRIARRRSELASTGDEPASTSAEARLAEEAFWITLDPESPNGHTLFADSANNGPRGRALVEELIPAIRAKYPLNSVPTASMLRGHSSGGWSTLWLALNYPDTFGAAWATSPDPVDFRSFQSVNIYSDGSMYTAADGQEICSFHRREKRVMTSRQENTDEEVLATENRSAQQWDSWQAVFGPRTPRGAPAALFDARTGKIDPAIADQYRAYDIANLTRSHAEKYIPIFRSNIRLIVGDQDNFYLNQAVALLRQDVEELAITVPAPREVTGYIRIISGDHGTIFRSPDLAKFPQEMLDHLKRSGVLDKR